MFFFCTRLKLGQNSQFLFGRLLPATFVAAALARFPAASSPKAAQKGQLAKGRRGERAEEEEQEGRSGSGRGRGRRGTEMRHRGDKISATSTRAIVRDGGRSGREGGPEWRRLMENQSSLFLFFLPPSESASSLSSS